MRISTSQIFDSGARQVGNSQSALYKIQNQLSTRRRFLSAQDDPVAAAQVLLDTQARAVLGQYADNQGNANGQLALEEERLKSVVESVIYIKTQVLAGRNATLSDSQREFFAKDLQQQLDYLTGIANSADAAGHYLFSGFQGETQPFQKMADGTIQYFGDDGQRLLQVGSDRQIAVSDSGRDVFINNRSGNGTFATGAALGNTGTGVISNGSVIDPVLWAANGGAKFELSFVSATQYDLKNNGVSVPGGPFTYTPGSAITPPAAGHIGGISFSIGGTPAAGDSFSVEPSTNKSLFATVQEMINVFSTPVQNNAAAATMAQNQLNAGMDNLDQALSNVSRVQASIGSRRQELNNLMNVSKDLDLQYTEKISKLQDLDYADAISRFMSQSMQLEAAQKSFAQISGLSLFRYI